MTNNPLKKTLLMGAAAFVLGACQPELVSLQPIGAPAPESASTTFVDADGCSWWVIGNATNLSWAPMTNANGEHVCDGGQTQIVPTNELVVTGPAQPDLDAEPEVMGVTVAPPRPVANVPFVTPRYFVQVATFANLSNAQASQSMFESRGLKVSAGADQADSAGLYKLVLGPFDDEVDAIAARTAAVTEGFADAFTFTQ